MSIQIKCQVDRIFEELYKTNNDQHNENNQGFPSQSNNSNGFHEMIPGGYMQDSMFINNNRHDQNNQ